MTKLALSAAFAYLVSFLTDFTVPPCMSPIFSNESALPGSRERLHWQR